MMGEKRSLKERAKSYQEAFEIWDSGSTTRSFDSAEAYAVSLMEELKYTLRFNFYECEFEIWSDDDVKVGTCLNLWEMDNEEHLKPAIEVMEYEEEN